PGLQIGPGDVASVALVLAAALLLATGRAWLPRAVLPAFGPMAAAVAVGTMCSTSVESSLPGFVRNVQLFVLVPVAVVALVRDRRDLAIVCSSLIALGLAESGYGIWQSATGNGAAMGEENIRAVGTFGAADVMAMSRSEEHTSALQSRENLVCRLPLWRPRDATSFPYTTLFRSWPSSRSSGTAATSRSCARRSSRWGSPSPATGSGSRPPATARPWARRTSAPSGRSAPPT